jgi:hypothetical protein
MADTSEPRISSITLDEATRARIAQELGFANGIEAVPTEIAIVAVDPEEAGQERDSEVTGFADLRSSNTVFYNPSVTPAVMPQQYVAPRPTQTSGNRWVMVTVI